MKDQPLISQITNQNRIHSFLQQKKEREVGQYKLLKVGVWAYFLLLIFEGALRKWFLPFLATPLLVVRDPIALWVVVTAFNKGILKANSYINAILIIGILSFLTTILIGHGNVAVAIFGLRILLIHFPFMFAMGAVFTKKDVIKLGRVTLWIAIPMAVLIGLQFYSPQSAWVNRGVGGDERGAGFSGALGYFRPPGTFSFTNGNVFFFSFLASYIFYFWVNPKSINRLLLIGSSVALLASIPLSISRTLLFSVSVTLFFTLIGVSKNPKYFGKIAGAVIGMLILLFALSQTLFFQTATEAFTARFTSANESEGGIKGVIGDRYFGGMIGAITNSSQLPFFGYGLGMGTNVGAMLLNGKLNYLISEGEWGRLIGEMGLLLGLLTIILRLGFCLQISILAFQRLKYNDLLPWMMLSFALLNVPQGQWAQPTSLGFSTLIGGLILAALNSSDTTK